ncbi:hypothetical protein AAMO2058_001514000 [Amorphochlora amoebiformis]
MSRGKPDPFLLAASQGEGFSPAKFFKNDLTCFVRYLYDQFKFDVPIPCIEAHYPKDVKWTFGGPVNNPQIPLTGRYVGHSGMVRFLTMLQKLVRVDKWERKEFISQGHRVVVILEATYTILSSGRSYSVEEVHIHRVVDWQSKEVWILFDYTPVLNAWAPPTLKNPNPDTKASTSRESKAKINLETAQLHAKSTISDAKVDTEVVNLDKAQLAAQGAPVGEGEEKSQRTGVV